MKIIDLTAREILDSKGSPTVEAEVTLENGVKALGQVPSGASTGSSEAQELRDNGKRYHGNGVRQAVENVISLKEVLVGKEADGQKEIDQLLCETDGTKNKSRLGANTVLSISMAVCRAAARSQNLPLYTYFGKLTGNDTFSLPRPQILMIEGGKHGNWSTDIQEYMVMPKPEVFGSFSEMLRVGTEIYRSLQELLEQMEYNTGVGFEGAFCPDEIKSNEEALSLVMKAVEKAGYTAREQIELAVDVAASEFFDEGTYVLKSEHNKMVDARLWADRIVDLVKQYPLCSVEDPLSQEEWGSWKYLVEQLKEKVVVVGDDLLSTNGQRIQRAINEKTATGVVIKPNQIGTMSETLEAIKLSHEAGFVSVVSHRAGETNDDLIADLAVGTVAEWCKFGAPTRGERVAKYNRLLRIEEALS